MFKRVEQETIYDDEIKSVLKSMSQYGPDSPEYKELMRHLDGLTSMKMRTNPPRQKLGGDTILMVVGNILGIGLIVGYEQKSVITSKAITFVGRLVGKTTASS